MSLQLWGESPHGQWKLEINEAKQNNQTILDKFELFIHGTKERPRVYDMPQLSHKFFRN